MRFHLSRKIDAFWDFVIFWYTTGLEIVRVPKNNFSEDIEVIHQLYFLRGQRKFSPIHQSKFRLEMAGFWKDECSKEPPKSNSKTTVCNVVPIPAGRQ